MIGIVTKTIRQFIRGCGFDIVRYQKQPALPPDFTKSNIDIYKSVMGHTMTSPERVNALIEAVSYVVANKIPGAFVECGVWKGGSAMAMALALKKAGDESREIYLYDTFAGMTAPTSVDVSINGEAAAVRYLETQSGSDSSDWCLSTVEDVRRAVLSTGYPEGKFHFVKGKVEATIPETIPRKIALLRLDTDWYASTKHELKHLFPLLEPKGVLIVDDYGNWEGARKAVDEYICENNIRIFLNRIDYTGRLAIKTP